MSRKTIDSPIEEIHRARREISDRFAGDIAAIAEDAAQRQAASDRPIWHPKETDGTTHLKSDAISQESDSTPAAG